MASMWPATSGQGDKGLSSLRRALRNSVIQGMGDPAELPDLYAAQLPSAEQVVDLVPAHLKQLRGLFHCQELYRMYRSAARPDGACTCGLRCFRRAHTR